VSKIEAQHSDSAVSVAVSAVSAFYETVLSVKPRVHRFAPHLVVRQVLLRRLHDVHELVEPLPLLPAA
jgi:hypothetical protein